jgi:hypothetical protein
MRKELQALDIAASPELMRLAEEVERSGVGRLLKRGDREIAVLTPVATRRPRRPRGKGRTQPVDRTDSIFNIVGMCSTEEPTDIAAHKHEYLAEAYYAKLRHPKQR